jgi:O-antigen/teichoic acid export membrane protein
VRRQVIALAAANAAALLAAVLAYLAYSRLLTPGQFALLSGAMALAKFGNLVLDGGIKTAVIKHNEDIGPAVRRALFCASMATALVLVALSLLVMLASSVFSRMSVRGVEFLSAYACAYVLTYPFLFLHLADLERNRRFAPVATWESISIAIEYLLPVPCWFLFGHSFVAFVAAVWLARIIRVTGMRAAHGGFARGEGIDWRGASAIFHEGWKFQVAAAICMVRDNLHYLLVAPAFGKVWVGFYSWAMQLATVSSQIFVQTASRVALPVLRLEKDEGSRWASTLVQMKWLAIFTLPFVAFLYHFAAIADRLFFSGRWAQALILVLAFSMRMLPSIATTALGFLVLAQRGSGSFALGNLWWTVCEVVAAAIALWTIGVKGLACSCAVMAWVGVVIFARTINGGNVREVLSVIVLRPSLLVSVLASMGFFLLRDWFGLLGQLLICAVLVAVAIIAEPDVRALAQGFFPRKAHQG